MIRRLRILAVALAALAVTIGPHTALVTAFALAVFATGGMTALIARRILADLQPLEAIP